MGQDKTDIPLPFWHDVSLVQWAAQRIGRVCAQWVVADRGRGLVPGAVSVADGPGAGPAAGLLGAADRFPGRALLALACDLPLIPALFLSQLARSESDWVVPVTEQGPEPLCALYGPRAIELLGRRVADGKFSLRDLPDADPTLEIHRIEGRELLAELCLEHWPPETFFTNVNRPRDLQRAAAVAENAALRQEDFLRAHSTRG